MATRGFGAGAWMVALALAPALLAGCSTQAAEPVHRYEYLVRVSAARPLEDVVLLVPAPFTPEGIAVLGDARTVVEMEPGWEHGLVQTPNGTMLRVTAPRLEGTMQLKLRLDSAAPIDTAGALRGTQPVLAVGPHIDATARPTSTLPASLQANGTGEPNVALEVRLRGENVAPQGGPVPGGDGTGTSFYEHVLRTTFTGNGWMRAGVTLSTQP